MLCKDHAGPAGIYLFLYPSGVNAHHPGRAQEGRPYAWIERFQQGQEFMADAIAQKMGIGIAGILHWNDDMLSTIGDSFCMTNFQQWANDILLARQHPNHARQPGTT